MKYILLLISIVLLNSCEYRTSRVLPRDAGTQNIIATLSDENSTLKQKEQAYRNMIREGTIGLQSVMQQERDEEIAQARRIALWVSLASILGFVAGCVLLYLGSHIFGMVALVASGALLIGCLAYASFIQWAGPMLSAILGVCVVSALAYEIWKNRKALHFVTEALPGNALPPAPVQRLVQKVQRRADKLRQQAKTSVDDALKKVG